MDAIRPHLQNGVEKEEKKPTSTGCDTTRVNGTGATTQSTAETRRGSAMAGPPRSGGVTAQVVEAAISKLTAADEEDHMATSEQHVQRDTTKARSSSPNRPSEALKPVSYSEPLIPVAPPPGLVKLGVGRMDEDGNALFLGAGALQRIREAADKRRRELEAAGWRKMDKPTNKPSEPTI